MPRTQRETAWHRTGSSVPGRSKSAGTIWSQRLVRLMGVPYRSPNLKHEPPESCDNVRLHLPAGRGTTAAAPPPPPPWPHRRDFARLTSAAANSGGT